MANISVEEVKKIAVLARLGLSEAELQAMSAELSSILAFVEQLQDTETANIEPTSQVTGLQDVWRADQVVRCELSREQLLRNAPQTQDGFVKVKRVL